MRASGGETAGAITTSCCAPARLRQHHDTVPYREALVSWLLRERLGQADQNDLIWMPRLVIPEVPPTVQIGGTARVIRELVDHAAHHPAPGRARAACSARPGMSHTTFTVPHMNKPPRRHDITIRVAKQAGRHPDPAAFAAAASQAAAGRDASILSAHTVNEIICGSAASGPVLQKPMSGSAGPRSPELPSCGHSAAKPNRHPLRTAVDSTLSVHATHGERAHSRR